MLVLSRKAGESVYLEIPPSSKTQFVEVRNVGIRPNTSTARLGIQAPRHIRIVRGELIGVETPEMEVVAA